MSQNREEQGGGSQQRGGSQQGGGSGQEGVRRPSDDDR